MTLLIAGGVIAWLTIGVWLSAFMARRGYDRTSWLVVGLLFGPVTLIFATVELAWALPRRPHTFERGRPGSGSVDVLTVIVDHDPALVNDALDAIGDDTHRLVLAQVLPFDGAKAVESEAASELRDHAAALARPWAELALVFGAPATAISAFAVQDRFGVVVTDRDVPGLRTSLRDAGVELRSGHAAVKHHVHGLPGRPHLTLVEPLADAPSRRSSPSPQGPRAADSTRTRSTRPAGADVAANLKEAT